MNSELQAAWTAVPGVASAEKTLADVKARRATARAVAGSPAEARTAVINAAAETVAAGGKMPAGVGAKAADAYLAALAAAAEFEVLAAAQLALEQRLTFLKANDAADDALRALNVRLSTLLDEARPIVERLAGVETAEDAVDAGGSAADDLRRIRQLVRTVSDVRQAQGTISQGAGVIGGPLSMLRKVCGHARGLASDAAPSVVLDEIADGRHGIRYLRWLVTVDAWAPTPDELNDEYQTARALELGEPIPDGKPEWTGREADYRYAAQSRQASRRDHPTIMN